MLDTPTLYNSEDFRTRYRHTFGWLIKDNNEKVLVFIKDVGRQVVFTVEDGSEYFANAGFNVMFEFLPITRGWFDTRNGPVLLQRVPARQYQRGISKSNTSCTRIGIGGHLLPVALTIDVLVDVFVNKPTSTFQQFVKKEKLYLVVNKFFLLSHGFVYMYDMQVGSYTLDKNNKVFVLLDNAKFKQELTDSFTRNNISSEVTCG